MGDVIRKVDYFAVTVSNRPGAGFAILDGLRKSGVNLLAFTGFPSARRAQVDFIPESTAAFTKAAKKMKLAIGKKKTGFLVQGDDRTGAVADVLSKLAAGRINVTALDAVSAGGGRWGAIFWVKPKDVAKAAKALRAG